MKRLFIISGTMGIGKTTVSQQLKHCLPNSVFLDGDWCWDASPFQVTAETKAMVVDNICHLLRSFLNCTAYDNVIFCWVMHQQSLIDDILSRLNTSDCRIVSVSLIASEDALRRRLQNDILSGVRTADIIERSLSRLPLYNELNTQKIDTSSLTPYETALKIAALQEE